MQALGIDVLFKGTNPLRLLQGLWIAVQISGISVALSLVLGVLGVNLTAEFSAIIVFTFWGTGEMGDLVRGALASTPRHQYESAAALGLTRAQSYRHVIIPQAVRRLVPAAINLVTRMVKTTSLLLMVGIVETMKVGQQIIEANRMTSPNAVFGVFGEVMRLYFAVCWPISLLANHLSKKWN